MSHLIFLFLIVRKNISENMFIATYLLALLKFQTGGNQIRISFSCNRQRHIPGGTPSVGHIPRSITLMVYFGEKKMFRAQYDSAKPTA